MIFQVYSSVNEHPEPKLTPDEKKIKFYLEEKLIPFPINRIKLRKDYSENSDAISIEIELDSTIASEEFFNIITIRLLKELNTELVTIERTDHFSNFDYFYYGETVILNYSCSIFIDVPKKAYIFQKDTNSIL